MVLDVHKKGKRGVEGLPAGLGAALVLLERHLVDDQVVHLLLGIRVIVLNVKIHIQVELLTQLVTASSLLLQRDWIVVFATRDSHVDLADRVVGLFLQVLVVWVD